LANLISIIVPAGTFEANVILQVVADTGMMETVVGDEPTRKMDETLNPVENETIKTKRSNNSPETANEMFIGAVDPTTTELNVTEGRIRGDGWIDGPATDVFWSTTTREEVNV
jgi:hypothetical protein